MAGVAESTGQASSLAANLQTGVDSISSNQTVTFTKYVRAVLPLDGTVFWVKASIAGPSALYNAALMNAAVKVGNEIQVGTYNAPVTLTAAATAVAKGSLHYLTDTRQEEGNTIGVNLVVFTSEQEITDLNEVGPNVLFIGVIDGVKFAFSSRASFYRQAGLWHYTGTAVYPDMETQVVDDPRALNLKDVVVSNSLPVWLALNGYVAPYGFSNPGITLYPSFLVPQNIVPPYASVHIDPAATRALTSAPLIGRDGSHSQLCADVVRVTMFGMRNFNALDFLDCVLQRSLDGGEFGIMSASAIRDEKRTQSELNAIGQKKTVTFEVSYNQSTMRSVARKLITAAVPTYDPTDLAAA